VVKLFGGYNLSFSALFALGELKMGQSRRVLNRTYDRRRFLISAASGLAIGPAAAAFSPGALSAREESDSRHGPIKVVDIEVHDISAPYVDWIAYPLNHYYGPSRRTVYVARTDNGLVGLGESGSREPDTVIQQYVGSNPFDWIGDETSLGLGTAMYDLMGQAASVPVYKLFGQRYRRFVPVGSWTVSTHPRRMAQAVTEYAARGYTWLKYHLSPFENVIDQLRAMQEVAPKGFKVHFDLTMGGTDDHTPGLLEKMAEFPISGCFEDPLYERDIDSYIELRKRSRLPILVHHSSLGFTFDVLRRAGDAYIVGHAKIGDAIRYAGLFAAANAPFMLQNVGGTITRTMNTHMQAAFKTASFHFHSDTETWKADVVKERLEPVNGLLRVPEKPGLGLTLDRSALERLKHLQLPEKKKWIIKTSYANGTLMYNIADPKQSIFMVRPDGRRLLPLSYDAPVSTEYWDDDGSADYKSMFGRIEREGVVLVRG
jgi:L-alanine-DL-glutamate epimerase-like enolase superfamily enzyme